MRIKLWFAATLLPLCAGVALAADKAPESWDGLVQVKSKYYDMAYVAPGADFRPYTKLMIDPTQVAFHKDWMKNVNDTRNISDRVTEKDAKEMLEAARSNFDDLFGEAFTKAGFTIVTAPGPDVLRVQTGVANLYVNAPDVLTAGRQRTYTANAGEATLIVEVRDSSTGALLGRVVDRRETRDNMSLQRADSVSNVADFRALFRQWASIAAKGLTSLKAISPVPATLQPGQRLDK